MWQKHGKYSKLNKIIKNKNRAILRGYSFYMVRHTWDQSWNLLIWNQKQTAWQHEVFGKRKKVN